jgi:uncharacterized protein involved in exopolysaccharide biosynthesis
MTEQPHFLTVQLKPEVLDQVVKSLMQSVTANSSKRRRLNVKSQTYRDAAREGDLLNEGLTQLLAAQQQSFAD